MKNKTKGIILGLIVAISLVAMFLNQPIKTKKEIRYNETHKEEDVHMIMDDAIKSYKNDNSKVYSVYYDENKSKKMEAEYVKKGSYREVIIVYVEFKTSFFNAPEQLDNNHYYFDYMYIAGKTAEATWEWIDGGYV